MKIGKPSEIAASTPAATQAGASRVGGRAAAGPSGRARNDAAAPAGVTVSVRSHALAQIDATGNDIDMSKVEAVRAAIQQGTFKINPEVIADKLLANARDMLAGA